MADADDVRHVALALPHVVEINSDGLPLVMLRLAQVKVDRLRDLVTDAWRMRAPAALAAEHLPRRRAR